jgi:hypothetical protein
MPAGAPDAGVWLCDNKGETVTVGGAALTFALHALRRLGSCPGAPVPGQISYCEGDATSCTPGQFDGSINGAPFHAEFDASGADPQQWWEDGTIQGGGIFGWSGAPGTPGTGFLVAPASFSDPDSLYCLGSVSYANAGQTTASDLSRLGPCADAVPVSGELDWCAPATPTK